jgi:hypothetical protein
LHVLAARARDGTALGSHNPGQIVLAAAGPPRNGRDGLTLTRAFMRIKDVKLRRMIVKLVEQLAGDD